MIELNRAQFAQFLGVKVRTLREVYEKHYPDFPEPSKKINQKNVWWRREDCYRFAERLVSGKRGRR